jgi:hypothetical protein
MTLAESAVFGSKQGRLEVVAYLARRPVSATKSGAEAMSRRIRKQFNRS